MKRKMCTILALVMTASNICGCSENVEPVKVYASEDISKYNSSIVEICNYEYSNGNISEDNKVSNVNITDLKNAINSNQVNYLVDITDDMTNYENALFYLISDGYTQIHHPEYYDTGIGESEETLSEDELNAMLEAQNKINKHRQEADDIVNNIKSFSSMRESNYEAYLDLVYNTCNSYNNLPEEYKSFVINKNELKNEVEMLGGILEKNFNIEKQKYLYEVKLLTQGNNSGYDDEVEKTFDGEIEPYTGVSDEELGLAETLDSSSPYGRKRGENYTESSSSETVESSESTESNESIESNESNEYETTSEVISETVEETLPESINESETTGEETEQYIDDTQQSIEEATNEYTSGLENETSENVEDTNTLNNITFEDISRQTNIPVEVLKMIDEVDEYNYNVRENDIRKYIASLDDKLSYTGSNWYVNIENAPESGEIDLPGGYYISWIKQENELSEYEMTDYIYWDAGGFKVRCINKGGRSITLEGYISEDVIYINNISNILDSINPARAYIYER